MGFSIIAGAVYTVSGLLVHIFEAFEISLGSKSGRCSGGISLFVGRCR